MARPRAMEGSDKRHPQENLETPAHPQPAPIFRPPFYAGVERPQSPPGFLHAAISEDGLSIPTPAQDGDAPAVVQTPEAPAAQPSSPSSPPPSVVGEKTLASYRIDEPLIALTYEAMDGPELGCAANRLDHLASILDNSERSEPSDFSGEFHHAIHVLPDRTSPAMTGIENDADNRFFERYDYAARANDCRTFTLRVETSKAAASTGMLYETSQAAAQRVRLYRDSLIRAARLSGHPIQKASAITPGVMLATYIDASLPGTIPGINNSIQTAHFPTGQFEAILVPRIPSPLQPATILRPAALAKLVAVLKPSGRLSIREENSRLAYRIDAIREVVPMTVTSDDPMIRLRIIANLPDLGSDPYTDEFIELYKALAR